MNSLPFATEIQALRYRAGLDQSELATALGITQGDMSRYETGKVRPHARRYRRIVEYLEAVISGDDDRAQAIRDEAA